MLWEQSLHPPALDAAGDEEEEIPWALLENFAYVADRRNATTAYASCGCNDDGVIQASLFVARPPRVSYICVFYRCWPGQAEQQQQDADEDLQIRMIPSEPEVIATDGSAVLLRSHKLDAEADLGRRLGGCSPDLGPVKQCRVLALLLSCTSAFQNLRRVSVLNQSLCLFSARLTSMLVVAHKYIKRQCRCKATSCSRQRCMRLSGCAFAARTHP